MATHYQDILSRVNIVPKDLALQRQKSRFVGTTILYKIARPHAVETPLPLPPDTVFT